HGMTDEPSYYTRDVLDKQRRTGETLARLLAGTGARIRLPSGADCVAYFGHLDYAVEQNGLTDAEIARLPLRERRRPGHEKVAAHELLARKHVQLQLLSGMTKRLPAEAQVQLEDVTCQIIYWDSELMQRLASRDGVTFVDFPT